MHGITQHFFVGLDNNLGSVFSGIMEFIGIYKNTSSPHLFSINTDRRKSYQRHMELFDDIESTDCKLWEYGEDITNPTSRSGYLISSIYQYIR